MDKEVKDKIVEAFYNYGMAMPFCVALDKLHDEGTAVGSEVVAAIWHDEWKKVLGAMSHLTNAKTINCARELVTYAEIIKKRCPEIAEPQAVEAAADILFRNKQ
jgi:cytolysin (calcineurin-like family phosphatase)